jgi:SH3-like domain-containing protein
MNSVNGERTAIATDHYVARYPDPIDAAANAVVDVVEEDAEQPGWWWCVARDGRAGWVPAILLDATPVAGARRRLREAYSARELSVTRGDALAILDEYAGWIRVRNRDGECGWVPVSHVRRDAPAISQA